MKSTKEYNGAIIDNRPSHDKIKDFHFKEIVANTDRVVWQTKEEKNWKTYPIFDQKNSDQCVAFTIAKLMGISHQIDEGEFIDFSKSHIYERRSNFPSAGMLANDAFEITRKEGVTFELLYPSKTYNNNNDYLNIKAHYERVGEIFKVDSYLALPIKDIETVASVIQRTGKGVMVWFWGTYAEWDRDIPIIKDKNLSLSTASVRHSVTAVDFFIKNGQKCLLIEDSWGNKGINGRRIITEEFFSKRNYYAGYIMNFNFSEGVGKPDFKIKTKMEFGQTSEQIKELQKMLQHEGFFPANVSRTGYYGSITAKAVLNWQLKHSVDNIQVLHDLKGNYFGDKSLNKFKTMYSS